MTIGTDNAIPSDHPSDLLANAMNFDDAMNSSASTFTDRFGVTRVTWSALNAGIGTYAAMYALDPATYIGRKYICTDLGYTEWHSDGTYWRPLNGKVVLSLSTYYRYMPGNANFVAGTSGNFVLTTALNITHTVGAWFYIGTNSVSLATGWWWGVMSSATSVTLCGSAQSVPNNSPNTTPYNVAGSAAYTQDVNENTDFSYTLPANLMSVPGRRLALRFNHSRNGSGAQTATFRAKFGSNNLYSGAPGTTTLNNVVQATAIAQSTTRLMAPVANAGANTYGTSTSGNIAVYTIDTTTTNAITTSIDVGTASADWFSTSMHELEIVG